MRKTRAKMSDTRKGKKPSAEARVEMSDTRKRKKPSAETRAKISDTKMGESNEEQGRRRGLNWEIQRILFETYLVLFSTTWKSI